MWCLPYQSVSLMCKMLLAHDLVGLTISCGENYVCVVFMELLVRFGCGLRTSWCWDDVQFRSKLVGICCFNLVSLICCLSYNSVFNLRNNVVLWFGGLRHLLWGNSCVCCVWSSKGFVSGLETHDVQFRSELVGICYLNLISLTCLCQLRSWANKDITPDFLHFLGCGCHRCIALLWKGTSSTIPEVKVSCS